MSKKVYSILGCGWLGFPLAKKFVEKGIKIKGTTTTEEKLSLLHEGGIKPYLITIDENPVYKDFLEADVLLVMITSKKFEAYKNLVRQIEKSSVKKVIFISSTSVYPRGNKEYTEKDETIDSLLSKVELLFTSNKNFKTTVIRFAGLYGGKRLPGNWFEGREIPQPNGFVNMIHREDCMAIIEQIISKDIFGGVFNACANHHPSRKDFYIAAKKSLGKLPPVFDNSKALEYKTISPAKLIKTLDYTFKHPDLLNIVP